MDQIDIDRIGFEHIERVFREQSDLLHIAMSPRNGVRSLRQPNSRIKGEVRMSDDSGVVSEAETTRKRWARINRTGLGRWGRCGESEILPSCSSSAIRITAQHLCS